MDQAVIKRLKHVGQDVEFAENVRIFQPEWVSIGNNVQFLYGVYVQPCSSEVTIGDDTHFAPYAVLYGPLEIGRGVAVAAHAVFASVGHAKEPADTWFIKLKAVKKKIVVEDNVWIGANAVIIQGVRIGAGSIVGAGAVVTHDVEPYSVVGGVPARLIRKRR